MNEINNTAIPVSNDSYHLVSIFHRIGLSNHDFRRFPQFPDGTDGYPGGEEFFF